MECCPMLRRASRWALNPQSRNVGLSAISKYLPWVVRRERLLGSGFSVRVNASGPYAPRTCPVVGIVRLFDNVAARDDAAVGRDPECTDGDLESSDRPYDKWVDQHVCIEQYAIGARYLRLLWPIIACC